MVTVIVAKVGFNISLLLWAPCDTTWVRLKSANIEVIEAGSELSKVLREAAGVRVQLSQCQFTSGSVTRENWRSAVTHVRYLLPL